MTSPIISVENLGKRYTIRHQATGPTGGYRRLSEELVTAFKTPFRALTSRLRGGADSGGACNSSEDFWALRNVSFDVREGEVLGIIGRNGAGKSTLLKILSRITEPTEGRVTMRGRVASLLEVGTGFHPELTGRENVFLNGTILGMSRSEITRRFDEIVAFAEIERFLDTPVKRYSSGMYVRLAFAVAAHLDPEILVVDEVLAVGDAAFQRKCLGKMEDVALAGRTVFFVSHNMASIRKLCTAVAHLHRGTLTTLGRPGNVIRSYMDETTSPTSRIVISPEHHRVKSLFRIIELEIIDSKGRSLSAFEYGEAISLRIAIVVDGPVSGVRVGISLTVDGVSLTSAHSDTKDFTPKKNPTWLTCHIEEETLRPGVYSVQLGAHLEESGRGLDWIPDAAAFQVLEFAAESRRTLYEKEVGFFSLRCRWDSESGSVQGQLTP